LSIDTGRVLYIGNNIELVEALLSINFSIKASSLTHLTSIDELEKLLSKSNYTHFICEEPILASEKARISKHYPSISCTYLSKEVACNEVTRATPSEIRVPISDEVKVALNYISLPIYYKNKNNEVIFCNGTFSQLFDLLPNELIDRKFESLFPDGLIKMLNKSEISLKNPDSVDLLECRIGDKNGQTREFLLREQALPDGGLTIGMLFDVSEMNVIKRSLEKERLMLRATTDISSDLIFFKDLESRFIGCNKQFETFVGYPEADIIGKKDDELFELSQALMCQAQDSQVTLNGEVYAGNEYLTYNNGEEHYIFMQKVPLTDKKGRIHGLIGIGRDITEKSLIKKQLKVANVVFENSRDGMLVTDGSGEIISLNDACAKISGYSKGEILGEQLASFAYGGENPNLALKVRKSLKEHGRWQGNMNFLRKNGELGYFWLDAYEVKFPETGLANRIYSFTDLTKNKYNEEKIHYLSKHDSLTGLSNRIALFNHLETAIARANYKQIPMGILFIEVKGFKVINERYGHNQGDLIIKDVAKRLKESISDTGIAARLGDHQFALVVEELDNEQEIALIAQKIAQQFATSIVVEGMTVNLSSSIGISICPDDGVDLDTILSNAESAMLRSKQDKSSSYHFYTNELTVNSAHQIELENELKLALEEGQFEAYYQPQYDLNTRQVVAVESLLRWNHPEQGLLLPSRFLMLAEQSGLLIEIGMNMFRQIAQQAAKWYYSGIHFGRISITLSKLELSQISLIGSIQQVLKETSSEASWFEFEIEESLFSSDVYTIQENLLNFSRLGIALTVDGFGAERSVLYSIDKLNIEKFKISKHFIQGVPGYLAGEAMIKSVFVLANTLGIDVVGEGLENITQDFFVADPEITSTQNQLDKGPMKASETTFYLRCHKRK